MLFLSENYKIFTCAQYILQNKSVVQFCSWRANHLYKVSVHIGLYFDVLEGKKSTLLAKVTSEFFYFSVTLFFFPSS